MKDKAITILIISSIIFLLSIAGSHYVFAIGVTQWVIVLVIIMISKLHWYPLDLMKFNDTKLDKALKERKYLSVFAYAMSMPAVAIGVIWVVVLVVMVWFIQF